MSGTERRLARRAASDWPRHIGVVSGVVSGGVAMTAMLAVLPRTAAAHEGKPLAPHDLASAWSRDPGVVVPLLAVAALYLVGRRSPVRGKSGTPTPRRPARSPDARRHDRLALGAWLALVAALASPLHALGEALFSAHMVQHLLLMGVAAPLVVLAHPIPVILRGMPGAVRRRAPRLLRSPLIRRITTPRALPAWIVHAVVIWAWHTPRLYAASVTNEWMHALQHASFLAVALAFWYTVIPAGAASSGVAVLSLFTTALHTSVLGALLTVLPDPRFAPYLDTAPQWGLTPLEDQQLAGLVMWVPGGILYLLAALGAAYVLFRPRQTALGGR